MTDAFMAESAVREKYGFSDSDNFNDKFSKVSIEGLIFYVVAFGIWVLEKIFDTHKADVEEMLADRLPHTSRWYRNLVLSFQPDWADTPPVKYCSVDDRGCRLRIKIAGGEAGARTALPSSVADALEAYLEEEKDAGLHITIINENCNRLKIGLAVWYDPIALLPSEKTIEARLKEYVSSLDFDGLLTENAIVDTVQAVNGVKIVELTELKTKYADNPFEDFGHQRRAESGYWNLPDINISVSYNRYNKEDI